MSNGFWIKLSKKSIIDALRLIALHTKDESHNRLIKELNHALKTIEETDKKHTQIFGKRGADGMYRTNSFVNGLKHAKDLFNVYEGGKIREVIQKEIEKFET